MNRRAYLQGVGVGGGIVALAGCLGSDDSLEDPGGTVSLSTTGGDDSWPQLAHDARNSRYAPGASVPTGDVEVVWREFGDRPLSHPVIDDAVYLTDRWNGSSAYALAPDDGAELWRDPSEAEAHVTPALVDGILSVARTEPQSLHALDASSGTTAWTRELEFDLPIHPEIPPFAQTVSDGRIVAGTWGGVCAVDADSGTVRWDEHFDGDGSRQGGATPAVLDGRVFTFPRGYTDEVIPVYAFDATTGERDWKATLEFDEDRWLTGHPVAGGDHVYVLATKSTAHSLAGEDDSRSGSDATQQLIALDATSGSVDWRWDVPGHAHDPPALAEDVLFLGQSHPDTDGSALVTLDATKGEPIWVAETDSTDVHTPTVTSEFVCVSHGGDVAAFAVKDGSLEWEFDPDDVVTSVAVTGERVYALTNLPLGTHSNGVVALEGA
ncbi:PQQ-binding-like beta-propeller repeat protein [Natronoglomus mannanivorans]|uniref:PQQ-like beta-propeller repeat protein n=1 Tax=Natronoglomus mannanivorans TaxID=2979990 RepID=A0AAP2YWE3_9EURY|nr:PQQ-like beta-propeller repeat protein [Halobacteria archaeon AArc-xg1-1]